MMKHLSDEAQISSLEALFDFRQDGFHRHGNAYLCSEASADDLSADTVPGGKL
jgi:hypothetical protein